MPKDNITDQKTPGIGRLKKLVVCSVMLVMMCSPLTAFASVESEGFNFNYDPYKAIFENVPKIKYLKMFQKKDTENKSTKSKVLSIKKDHTGISFNINSNFKKGYIKLGKNNGKYSGLSIFEQTKLPFNKEFKYSFKLD